MKLTLQIRHYGDKANKTLEIHDSQLKFVEDGQDIMGFNIITAHNSDGLPVPFKPTYFRWMQQVNSLVMKISGLITNDIPDFDYRMNYDDDITPWETACGALIAADFPFPNNFEIELGEKDGLIFLATFMAR
jgi:hypothetical protein